jgi:hypothetical protein
MYLLCSYWEMTSSLSWQGARRALYVLVYIYTHQSQRADGLLLTDEQRRHVLTSYVLPFVNIYDFFTSSFILWKYFKVIEKFEYIIKLFYVIKSNLIIPRDARASGTCGHNSAFQPCLLLTGFVDLSSWAAKPGRHHVSALLDNLSYVPLTQDVHSPTFQQ